MFALEFLPPPNSERLKQEFFCPKTDRPETSTPVSCFQGAVLVEIPLWSYMLCLWKTMKVAVLIRFRSYSAQGQFFSGFLPAQSQPHVAPLCSIAFRDVKTVPMFAGLISALV